MKALAKDPYNVIITGVGGQGNVMASRLLGNILSHKGYYVTIGETFGASQRGGSVMSHLRVSQQSVWSPQIPKGKADIVVVLEPLEALRVMPMYGNEGVKVIANTRPIHPAGVIAGDFAYPTLDEIREALAQLAVDVFFISATDEAMKLGNPILANVIMMGALAATEVLPFDMDDFREALSGSVSKDKVDINMKAFSIGMSMIRGNSTIN